MNNPVNIRHALAGATASLLGLGAAHGLEATAPWEIDSRLLYYSEKNRVEVVEGVAKARWNRNEDQGYGLSIVVDAMTGASPNGAIPTSTPQTFTRPSGAGTYTVTPNSQPLDDTFHDTRVALILDMDHSLGESMRLNYSLQGSTEFDYQSLGGSLGLDTDFNQRNTTLSLGLSVNFDTSSPVGGIPDPEGFMPSSSAKPTIGDSDNKLVFDTQIGLTQILTPHSLIQSTIVFGSDDGYLNDPYKLVSVVDPLTGEPVADADQRYRYDNRPDRKFRWAWYTAYQQQFRAADVLRLSYRLYGDDWGTMAHTVESFYRWQFAERHFLEPQLRVYTQSAADFYRTSLPSDQDPEYVSADYRLADMQTYTTGLTWGFDINSRNQIRLGAAYYIQQATPSQTIGAQRDQDLIPDTEAFMIRLGYAVQF